MALRPCWSARVSIPRVAQQLLRHASSKTTTEIHSHITAAQERQAADVRQAALAG